MPEGPYVVARAVARRLITQLELAPPFDVERVARRAARIIDADVPTNADVVVLHAKDPGEQPSIVVDGRLAEDRIGTQRRRFAIAHGLGHVLLGWHPLGAPCDVSDRPHELPITVHDLVEGEANAFARELLVPRAWIESFNALDRPAELVRHVASRGGILLMPAARAVTLQLAPGWVWAVTDEWQRVLDAGRSPGTSVCAPATGAELEPATYARHAAERHRDGNGARTVWLWRFDASATTALPHDRSSRAVAHDLAEQLTLGTDGATNIIARLEGVAGWANEQDGTASLDGMERVLDARARTVSGLQELADHAEFGPLLRAKATELVAKRLTR